MEQRAVPSVLPRGARVVWLVALLAGAIAQPSSIGAATAPKLGAKCQTAGKVVKVAGTRLKCTKVRGRLIWVKYAPKPSASASPTPTPAATPVTPLPFISPTAVPTPPPSVTADRFAFQATRPDGSPVRWRGCEPITWTYFPEPTQPNGLDIVQKSLQMIADATGFSFAYVDPSTRPEPLWATIGDPNSPPDPAQLQVLFGDRRNLPSLTGVTLGETALYWSEESGEIAVSYVVLRPDVQYGRSAFGPNGVGVLMLHELLHAMGLGHVNSTRDLMYPDLGVVEVSGLAAGDRYGLYQVSAVAPCRP